MNALKIASAAVVFAVVFYFIYNKSVEGNSVLILSPAEISSNSDDTREFKSASRIYFKYTRKNTSLKAANVGFEFEFDDKNGYRHHKQITYEIEKNFAQLDGYYPAEYFTVPGKYRIKVKLDGSSALTKDFTVE